MAVASKFRTPPDEDLFKDSTMSFGEHLEELRGCLFRAVAGLMVGFLVGLYFGDSIVLALQVPLKNALEKYYLDDSKLKTRQWVIEQQRLGQLPAGDDAHTQMLVDQIIASKMVFEQTYVSINDVSDALRRAHPDAAAPRPLYNPPGHPSDPTGPTTVLGTDIIDPVKLGEMITGGSPGHSGDFIANKLKKAPGFAEFQKLGSVSDMKDEDRKTFLAKVAAPLNAIVQQEKLVDQAGDVLERLTPEGQALRKSEQRNAGEERRLNRLILEAAFPGAIAPTHPELIPLALWRPVKDDPRTKIQSLSVGEVFGFWLKAAFVFGFILASPWIFWQLWGFVAAGLYPHEKRYIHLFLPISLGLFLFGAALAFFFVFEPVLDFLFDFNKMVGIDPDPRISEWMGFVLLMPLGFGVSFQLPLVMLFLEKIGVFTTEVYLAKWRIAVLLICVAAMLLTPSGDPYSMLLMAVPLVILYFGGVALCRWLPSGRNPYAEA